MRTSCAFCSPSAIATGIAAGVSRCRNDGSNHSPGSTSFTAAGRHSVKVGGEYIYDHMQYFFCNVCNGQLDARNGASVDLVKAGIVDPVKVSYCAVRNAASVAVLILTTQTLIAKKPDDYDPTAGPALGGGAELL